PFKSSATCTSPEKCFLTGPRGRTFASSYLGCLACQNSRKDGHVDVSARQDDRDALALNRRALLEYGRKGSRTRTFSDVVGIRIDETYRLCDLRLGDTDDLQCAFTHDFKGLCERLPASQTIRKGSGGFGRDRVARLGG